MLPILFSLNNNHFETKYQHATFLIDYHTNSTRDIILNCYHIKFIHNLFHYFIITYNYIILVFKK